MTPSQLAALAALRAETFALARAFDAEYAGKRGEELDAMLWERVTINSPPPPGKRYDHELAWLRSMSLLETGPPELDDLARIETALLHRWSRWPDEASAVPDWRERVRTLEADTEKLKRWVEGRL